MVPFQTAVNGVVIAVGIENKVFSILAEHRGIGIVPFFGNREFRLGRKIVNIDHRHLVGSRFGIGNPAAVGRKAEIKKLTGRVLHQGFLALGSDIHQNEAVLAVGIKNLFAVGTPEALADIGVVAFGQLGQFPGFRVFQVQFGFPAAVGNEGDMAAVGAPNGIAFMGTGRAAEVTGHAFLGWYVKNFPPGGQSQTGSVRCQADGCKMA